MNRSKMIKLTSSLALGAALLTGAVACSNGNDSSTKTSQTSKTTSSQTSKASSSKRQSEKAVKENNIKLDTQKIKLSQKEAIDKFNSQFKNTKIKSIDLTLEGKQYVYEIEAFDNNKEYSADINANTGAVSRAHSERRDHDDRHEQALNLDGIISRSEATKIAEKHANGTAQEWNLEQEGNKTYWDVEVSNGSKLTEVKIDAHSKQIVHAENDHDND